MKRLIISLFMSAVLICGFSAMAQNTGKKAKAPEKEKTEVKSEVSKKTDEKTKAPKKTKSKKTVVKTEKEKSEKK